MFALSLKSIVIDSMREFNSNQEDLNDDAGVVEEEIGEKKDEYAATKVALSAQDFLLAGDGDRANEELTKMDRLTRKDLTDLAWVGLGLNHHSDAEDVVQDVYLKAYRALGKGKFRGESKVETYLIRAVMNKARDHIDKHKRQVLIDDENFFEEQLTQSDPYERVERRLSPSAAWNALASISPNKKKAVVAVAIFGIAYKELSRREKIPVGTLKSWVARGKREIRDKISND